MTMGNFFKAVTRRAGLDVKRVTPTSSPLHWILDFARHAGVNSILDVGANEGQFAKSLFHANWEGEIISFEPLTTAHSILSRNASDYSRWSVVPRVAVGSESGQTVINVAGNSQSSSLLPMLDRHLRAAPASGYTEQETVPVETLCTLLTAAPNSAKYMLKMDVQGFELEVLNGAKPILDRVPLIYSELSLQPLYEGEALFSDLSNHIIALGYRCVGMLPGFTDPHSREMLQVDALFVRETGLSSGSR